MTRFTGTAGDDVANALTGSLSGFTGGTIAEVQDSVGDFLDGGSGHNIIVGGAGNDTLRSGGGATDILVGGGGDDLLVLSRGSHVPIAIHGAQQDGAGGATEHDVLRVLSAGGYIALDFRTIAVSNIDGLEHNSGWGQVFTIGADQFGSGFSTALSVGGQFLNRTYFFNVVFGAPGAFDASIWTLTNVSSKSSINAQGSAGNDEIIGWSLRDIVVAGGGRDRISTNAGDDVVYIDNAASGGMIDGGSGNDLLDVDWRGAESGAAFTLDDASAASIGPSGQAISGFEQLRFWGSDFADSVSGGAGRDTLIGGDGDDSLSAGAGNDALIGGVGNDTLNGGSGADYIFGGNGDDTIISGSTRLSASPEQLMGGAGIDRLIMDRHATAGSLVFDLRGPLDATASNSIVVSDGTRVMGFESVAFFSGSGNDDIFGGMMNDSIDGGDGRDSLSGRGGNDTLVGGGGSDTLDGGSGDDLIAGGTGMDLLDGGRGNDTLVGGAEPDQIDGGHGIDLVRFSNTNRSVVVDLGNALGGRGDAYGDVFVNVEHFELTRRNDVFIGIDNADTVFAGEGNDRVIGNRGRDTLYGEDGADTLSGGLNSDTLSGGAGRDVFQFDSVPALSNIDIITDYNVQEDTIWLDGAVFKAIGGSGVLNAGQFAIGISADDLDDRIIYDIATGSLLYDADGNKDGGFAAKVFAVLEPSLAITHSDFMIV